MKTQLTTCLDLLFPELHIFFKGNLHLTTSYNLLQRYSSPKEISNARITTLTKLLTTSSKGHYSYDQAVILKKIAKDSIGVDNPAISIQIKCLINQLALLKEQISSIDKNIKEIMDNLYSPILTIPGISYTLGAIILSEIGDIHKFSNPTKLLDMQA